MKTTVLGLRFTDEERADLKRTALGCGMKLTAWAREALLRDSNQVPVAHDHRVVATTKRPAHKTATTEPGLSSRVVSPEESDEWKVDRASLRPPPPMRATSKGGPVPLGSLTRREVTPVPKAGKK